MPGMTPTTATVRPTTKGSYGAPAANGSGGCVLSSTIDRDRPGTASHAAKRGESLVKPLRDPSLLIRLFYAICLAGASYNHATIVAAHGLDWNYGGLPVFVCRFWTALTFIDALAVILLMTKPKVGLALTVAIIVCDVAINSWVGMTYGFDIPSFVAQALFLVFVMSTVGFAWRAESGETCRSLSKA